MPNGEFVHMPVPSCSKQSLVSPSAALEIASSPSEGRKSDVMIISAPNSTVPGQQNREFMEDLESKKPAKIIEDRLAKKQTLLKTPADSSAVAGLRLKIKRKKLADKQIDSSLQSAKKKCTDLQKMSTMILEKSDSKEKSFSEDCSKKFSTVPSSGPGNMQTEEARQRDVGTWVRTVAGAAEAECLRCCEPGTSVTLDGIVWQETSTEIGVQLHRLLHKLSHAMCAMVLGVSLMCVGVLVVNVTWRGKSYVGTLLDCTKSDWSAPRFCDSPNPDASDGSKGTFKGRNMKRNAGSSSALNSFRNGGSGMCESVSKQNISSNKVGSFSGFEDQKLTPGSPASSVQPNDFILEPSSPLLFECPLSGYEKKFDKIVALKYHQNSSHEFRATRRKDASSCTDPAITGNICTDLRVKGDIFAEVSDETERALQAEVSKNDPKKYLSQAEHESLENLFKVITSTPVPQNNRHQQQKQLNSSSSTLISKTPPVLHVPDEIDGSCSDRERVKHVQSPTAVFSEVSDVEDEAPMLERHSSPLGTILVLKEGTDTSNKRSTSDKCRLDVDGVSVVEKRAADKRGTSAARISGIKNERTESSSPFALQQSDVHPSPLRVKSNPSSSGAAIQTYCNNSKNANYNSSFAVPSVNSFFTLPPVPPPAGAAPSLGLPSGCFDVGGASPGSSAPAFFSVGPPPTAPLSSNLGVVYPSVVGSIMTSPRPPYFGALPTPFGLPLPPNINVIAPSTVTTFVPTAAQNPATFFMPPTTLVTSHKIHQLGDSKKGSPVVLSPKASLSKCSPSSVISGAVRNEISTSSNGTEDAVDSVRSSSPPVQRHHHLHHHTHSYPMLASDPYVALYAGQQAAAAATVVSAYPSYPRK